MPRVYAVRGPEDEEQSNTVRAALAEFLSTFIFVFAGEGSVLALGMSSHTHTRTLLLDAHIFLSYLFQSFYLLISTCKSKNSCQSV